MANEQITQQVLLLAYEAGVNEVGETQLKITRYRNIALAATTASLAQAAKAIAGLNNAPLQDISKQVTYRIGK